MNAYVCSSIMTSLSIIFNHCFFRKRRDWFFFFLMSGKPDSTFLGIIFTVLSDLISELKYNLFYSIISSFRMSFRSHERKLTKIWDFFTPTLKIFFFSWETQFLKLNLHAEI